MLPVSQPTTASLSLRDAHLINTVLTLGYVLPLYLTRFIRFSFAEKNPIHFSRTPELGRDHPAVIKPRLLSVLVSTTASLCLMHYIVAASQSDSLQVSKRRSRTRAALMRLVNRRGGVQWPSNSGSL